MFHIFVNVLIDFMFNVLGSVNLYAKLSHFIDVDLLSADYSELDLGYVLKWCWKHSIVP